MAERSKQVLSPERARRRFLDTLRETGSVTAAARASTVSRAHWYRQRKKSRRFAAAWTEALDEGIDRLEEEALRRALAGTEQPVFFQGKKIGDVRRHSDALLMFLLRAHRPQRYRDGIDPTVQEDDPLRALLEEIDGKTRGLPKDRGEVA